MVKKWGSFADFIRNATEDEKREVYEIAMERAVEHQRKAIWTQPCAKCVTPDYCAREKWCYLGPAGNADSVPHQDSSHG